MIDVLGPEKRKRRSIQEKIAIVQQSFEPGMTVSLVDRQLCMWRKQYQEGSLTAVASGAHHWAVSTGGYDSETVQDVMLG
ncbi:transposase family protein, partial [Candidatus Erwinia dacicola]